MSFKDGPDLRFRPEDYMGVYPSDEREKIAYAQMMEMKERSYYNSQREAQMRDKYERERGYYGGRGDPRFMDGLIHHLGGNVRVIFQGWESNLIRLYESGWRISMERNLHMMEAQVIFQNDYLGLAALIPDMDMMRHRHVHELNIRHTVSPRSIMIRAERKPQFTNFELGASPRMQHMSEQGYPVTEYCLADILQPVDVEKLLIAREDEKTVDDLLAHILKKQAPLRQEIAERRVKETLIERPSAQLIKLFAA